MLIAIAVVIYEQSKDNKNIYIMIVAIVIFFYGMMRLSAKTPSKSEDKEEENV